LKKFIFDVDGTLTPSRKKIEHEFWAPFLIFCRHNDVYLVTGSDRQKTLEQLGLDICYTAKRVYNCSGSDVYEKDKNVYRDDWELPKDVEMHLKDEIVFSDFPLRNGNHIERRPGGVNFSILGRDEDPMKGRKEYISWDKIHGERDYIARRLLYNFPDLTVALGGQTGVDIGPKGADKSQILRDFSKDDELHFFGDRIEKGGNDHTLAMKIVENMMGTAYNVEDWRETRTILEGFPHDKN
jgi:phosphomannomutase